jgi:pyrroline-5-carboxylate reductase
MAEAMIQGILTERLLSADRLTACDVDLDRRRHLAEEYGIQTTSDGAAAIATSDVVVLAVKPQQLSGVLVQLRGRISSDALLLSIVAGATTETIQEAAQHRLVVRAMPNTPARIGKSATLWFATPEVSSVLRDRARAILQSIGLQLWVANEEYVELATGFTGPTPAFVFMIIEALVETGVGLGFTREDALALTLQTIEGSVALAKATGEHPAVLRGHVTSPGGATSAGLYVLEKAGLRATLTDAVRAVILRARELGAALAPRHPERP